MNATLIQPMPATMPAAPPVSAPEYTVEFSQSVSLTQIVRRRPKRTIWSRDWAIYVGVVLLVLSAWGISTVLDSQGVEPQKWFEGWGYWIGVVGGTMMLMLFSYPLRKHFRFAQNWGQMKWWFYVHMSLGLGGPWLILVHSTFRVGSLNAAVALYSMLIVAASGVIGRFIYRHVHKGLRGEEISLGELQRYAGMHKDDARSRLAYAPAVGELLKEFEQRELNAPPGWGTHLRRVIWLPAQRQKVLHECALALRGPLKQRAKRKGWSAEETQRQRRKAVRLVRSYLDAVVGVAQYSAYERVFALWHVAHIPFVYLLVLSSVVHVIAVHAY